MKTVFFSHRFAREILEHKSNRGAFKEVVGVCTAAPLFVWKKKSSSNDSLDIVQQVLNTYFDRKCAVDLGWKYHPLATTTTGSQLKADCRKTIGIVAVQVEVQFGNMSRWYSDVFKFQAAYASGLVDVGVSIVPDCGLAKRIDSNVANFERVSKELAAAKNSIGIPILVVGLLNRRANSERLDGVAGFSSVKELFGKKKEDNRYRIINAYLAGSPLASVSNKSPVGPKPAAE